MGGLLVLPILLLILTAQAGYIKHRLKITPKSLILHFKNFKKKFKTLRSVGLRPPLLRFLRHFLVIFGDFSKVLKLVDGFNGLILFSRLSTSTGTTSLSKDDENEAFNRCTQDALVVSEVFCLPSDYRKDVPPPSKFKFLGRFPQS